MLLYKDYLKSDKWKNIRDEVLKRDDFRCKRCGSALNLEFHHITYPADFNYDCAENIVTLCHGCHGKIHKGDLHQSILRIGNITDDDIEKMSVLEYARWLASLKDVEEMGYRELKSWSQSVSTEIENKFHHEMSKRSIIEGGCRISSIDIHCDGKIAYLSPCVFDIAVSYWLSNRPLDQYTPCFRLDTSCVKSNGDICKREQELIAEKLVNGSSKEAIHKEYILPYIDAESMNDKDIADQIDDWWYECDTIVKKKVKQC